MRSMLLDRSTWDLVVDAHANIAVADDPYSQAQDCASAQRTFAGECWYDTTKGVPYWSDVIGKRLSAAFLRSKLVGAAKTVPGVRAARVFFTGLSASRELTGQTQITDSTGAQQVVAF